MTKREIVQWLVRDGCQTCDCIGCCRVIYGTGVWPGYANLLE